MASPSRKPATQALSSLAPTKTTVLIANQHTAPIILPRSAQQGDQSIALPPLILHAGTVTPVEGSEWAARKELLVIQHYLDRGLIAEVNHDGPVPTMDATSTNLEDAIPENLKTEEEIGANASAKVTKATAGSVTVG